MDNQAALSLLEGRSQLAPARNRAERRDSGGLLDFDGAAAFLGVTPRAIQRLWQERRIAGVKVGKAVRFTESDLLAYIERHRVEAVR